MIGSIFYISGLTELRKPGRTGLRVNRKGIKLHGQFITWESVKDAQVKYAVVNKSGSIGNALVGGALAGEAGAIVGGMMGRKGVESYLHVTYKVDTQDHELIMLAVGPERLQKKLVLITVGRGVPPKRSLIKKMFGIW